MGLFLGSISERVVRQAIDEFLAGGLTAEIDGELQVETQSSRYRFIDGVCFSASEEDFVGSELVGWLLESDRATAVSAWWRRGARAVLLLRRPKPEIVVTSPTRALCVEGKPARDGFATHEARFIADDDAPVDALDEEISIEIDDTRPMRASTPMEAPRGFGMRLPSHHLPVAPHVASELGPVTLPPVRLPPRRWDAEPHAPARRWYG